VLQIACDRVVGIRGIGTLQKPVVIGVWAHIQKSRGICYKASVLDELQDLQPEALADGLGSILVGIELVGTGHGDAERGERVQDADGVSVGREHLRQALVAVGRLVQTAAMEFGCYLDIWLFEDARFRQEAAQRIVGHWGTIQSGEERFPLGGREFEVSLLGKLGLRDRARTLYDEFCDRLATSCGDPPDEVVLRVGDAKVEPSGFACKLSRWHGEPRTYIV